jgi:hypothetical protein
MYTAEMLILLAMNTIMIPRVADIQHYLIELIQISGIAESVG